MRREPAADLGQASNPTDAEALLRDYGCRATRSRVAVLEALLSHDGPIGAAELTELAQAREPSIHEATVYRTIGVLSELGLVNHVHAGHGPSLVRLATNNDLVAVCQDCGKIADVPAAAVAPLIDAVKEDSGFVLEPGHFALEAVCATCLKLR